MKKVLIGLFCAMVIAVFLGAAGYLFYAWQSGATLEQVEAPVTPAPTAAPTVDPTLQPTTAAGASPRPTDPLPTATPEPTPALPVKSELNEPFLFEQTDISAIRFEENVVVFIDEQPIRSQVCLGMVFIPAGELDNYGFDVARNPADKNMVITRNYGKEVALPTQAYINVKKPAENARKPVIVLNDSTDVLVDEAVVDSIRVGTELYIPVTALQAYATIEWIDYLGQIKLDLAKKDMENAMAERELWALEYPDADSAGLNQQTQGFLYARYVGEVTELQKNGLGMLRTAYVANLHLTTVESLAAGTWKNDRKDGFSLLEEHFYVPSEDEWCGLAVLGKEGCLQRLLLKRAYYENGVANGPFLQITSYFGTPYEEYLRVEGTLANSLLNGTVRLSVADEDYLFGYKIVYVGKWENGNVVLTDKELEKYYDKVFVPISADDWKKIEEDCDDSVLVPRSLAECFSELDKVLSVEEKVALRAIEADALPMYPSGLRQWIRNNWTHGTPNRLTILFRKEKIYFADDMATIIIEAYHSYLNGLDYDFAAAVRKTKLHYVNAYLLSAETYAAS